MLGVIFEVWDQTQYLLGFLVLVHITTIFGSLLKFPILVYFGHPSSINYVPHISHNALGCSVSMPNFKLTFLDIRIFGKCSISFHIYIVKILTCPSQSSAPWRELKHIGILVYINISFYISVCVLISIYTWGINMLYINICIGISYIGIPEAHWPVYQVENQEHYWENHQEDIVHLMTTITMMMMIDDGDWFWWWWWWWWW